MPSATSFTAAAASRPDTHRFLLLDFMRGIAAISVLLYHDGNFLYGFAPSDAYLAVDLFFLLSGFVIAHNYDRKIAGGMSLTDFMVQRWIRLYPCLLLTLLLGVAVFCLRFTRDMGFLDGWRILAAAGFNALFLPSWVWPYGIDGLFPFDGAAWSLTFELIANVLYWITFRQLNALRLGLLILLSAIGMTVAISLIGKVDIGMRSTDFWWGVPRVTLSFFIGVALRRYFYERMSLNLGEWAAPLVILCLLPVFSLDKFFAPGLLPTVELLAIGLFFPLLLLIIAGAKPGPRTAMLCKWSGDASYPVYLLQTPLMGVLAAVPQILWGMKAWDFRPWFGIVHVVLTILFALWIDRYFELPLRKLLRTRWERFKGSLAGQVPAA